MKMFIILSLLNFSVFAAEGPEGPGEGITYTPPGSPQEKIEHPAGAIKKPTKKQLKSIKKPKSKTEN